MMPVFAFPQTLGLNGPQRRAAPLQAASACLLLLGGLLLAGCGQRGPLVMPATAAPPRAASAPAAAPGTGAAALTAPTATASAPQP